MDGDLVMVIIVVAMLAVFVAVTVVSSRRKKRKVRGHERYKKGYSQDKRDRKRRDHRRL